LVLLRPQDLNDDPYWSERIFSKMKRRIVLNVQGQFKRQPQGTVFAGAEISQHMKLGLIGRSLAQLLLKLCESFVGTIHYSFGDGQESPHIVAPAIKMFERIVITPPGQTPPPMHEPFEESADSIAQRKRTKDVKSWINTTDTFSLSWYSMNVDLPTWRLVGLPMAKNIDLKTFWNDSLLRICMYEEVGNETKHLNNNYAWAIEAQHLGVRDDENDLIQLSGSTFSDTDDKRARPGGRSENRTFSESFDAQNVLSDDDDDDEFFDVEMFSTTSSADIERRPHVPSEARSLLLAIDKAVPSLVELCTSKGNYNRLFAVNLNFETVLRSLKDCKELLRDSVAASLVDEMYSPRMSSTERMRRMVGMALVRPMLAGIQARNLQAFHASDKLSKIFLKQKNPVLSESDMSSLILSGYTARAVSDRHWIEEWFQLTGRSISFYHPEKRKACFRIQLVNILDVRRLKSDESPDFIGRYFLTVETFGRSFYLMFTDEKERDALLHATSRQMTVLQTPTDGSNISVGSGSTVSEWRMPDVENPAEVFLHKSSTWECRHRRILNCGKFSFRHRDPPEDPLALVEHTLSQALEPVDGSDESAKHEFLLSTADLKRADILTLSEDAKLTFFLNLYHTMIMHAYLVLGPPDWGLKWLSYFNNIAYEVNDDVVSLTELEHCIVRNKMSNPCQFLSRFAIPRSRYAMALQLMDYRITFSLNCGSLSNPAHVLIYRVDTLHEQLDTASRMYLDSVVIQQKGPKELVLQLPRMCQWFFDDFGGSDELLLAKIEPFLKPEYRQMLACCWSHRDRMFDTSTITIKYLPYSFECRPLALA
jgi:hypothetical protein